MSKKLLKYFSFSLVLFLAISCAPRVAQQPSVYEDRELTLQEIIDKVSGDIEVIKAIAEVKIKRNGEDYSFVKASVLIKKPDWVHMRMYQLGMLVKDFVIKGDELYVLTGKKDENLKKLGRELHYAIFWWDHFREGTMSSEEDEYVVTKNDKRIYLDKTLLFPVRQEIETLGKKGLVEYSKPREFDEFWYPSLLNIKAGEFTFQIKLKKIIRNQALGEFDFRTPDINRN